MRKKSLFALLAVILLYSSCQNEDVIQNEFTVVENGVAIEVKTEALFENQVLIDWNVLRTLEADNLVYDVTVNGQKLADKINASRISIDGNSFKEEDKSDVLLDISISVYGNISETQEKLLSYETTEVVTLNSAPKAFEIVNLFTRGNGLVAIFKAPTDVDNDQVTFDFLLNGKVVASDIFFGFDNQVQTLETDSSGFPIAPINNTVVRVSQILNEFTIILEDNLDITSDNVLSIVAKDANGGETSTERTFNIKGSDVQLGVLESISSTEFEIDLTNEVDGTISYFFTLNEITGLRINYPNENLNSFNSFNSFRIEDEEGNNVFINTPVRNSNFLEAGSYEIIFFDAISEKSVVVIETFDANSQDKDLGLLALPFQSTNTIEFFKELDLIFDYKFQIDQDSEYRFEILNSFGFNFAIIDATSGEVFRSSFSDDIIESRFRERLPAGSYILRISRDFISSQSETFDLNLTLEGAGSINTENLGTLVLPFENEYDLNLSERILSNSSIQVFNFSIEETANYIIATDQFADFTIRNEFGTVVNSSNSTRFLRTSFSRDLQRGSYTLEIAESNEFNQIPPSKVRITLSSESNLDDGRTDVLGVVSSPFSITKTFDFSKEFSNIISYTFQITEDASYRIGTSLENTEISLYRVFPTFESFRNSGRRGIVNANESALQPGNYRIELRDTGFSVTAKGELLIAIE